jgi:hypothetical protein
MGDQPAAIHARTPREVTDTLDKRNANMNDRMCTMIPNHVFPVYILTLPDTKREAKLKRDWSGVLDISDNIERFMFYGVNGRTEWGSKHDQHKWDSGAHDRLLRSKLVNPLSGPSIKQLSNTEVAVGIGFLQIMLDVIEKKHEYAMILENDANTMVTDEHDNIIKYKDPTMFLRRLTDVLDNIPPKWDYLRLGACFAYTSKTIVTIKDLEITRPTFALCNHGFMLSKNACKIFIDQAFPIYSTIDHQMFMISKTHNLNDYGVKPHIIGQDLFTNPSESSIGYLKIEKFILWILRKYQISPRYIMQITLFLKNLVNRLTSTFHTVFNNNRKYESPHYTN